LRRSCHLELRVHRLAPNFGLIFGRATRGHLAIERRAVACELPDCDRIGATGANVYDCAALACLVRVKDAPAWLSAFVDLRHGLRGENQRRKDNRHPSRASRRYVSSHGPPSLR
jgi:hypothetical protein